MKVLLTVTGSWGTGSFQVAKGVAHALLQQGHQVKIFFPDNRVASEELAYYYGHPDLYAVWSYPLKKEQIRLDTFPLMLPDPNPRSPHAKTFKQLTQLERQLYFSSLKQQLQHLIAAFQPDAIECQHIWAMDHVIAELKQPFVSVAHNSDQLAYQFDPTMRTIAKRSAHSARYIFAVSEPVKRNVVELYGVAEDKVVVMPCGFEQNIFKPVTLDRNKVLSKFGLRIPAEAKLLSFSGKLSRTKGIDTLLQANRYLQKKTNVHLLIMGSGDIENVLSDAQRMQCCCDNVHFLGHLIPAEVAEINNIADVGVIPSRSEGFCIAGLETIACGTPIVMTDAARVAEYAVAAVVAVENPQQLAAAIVRLLNSPVRKQQQLRHQALQSAAQFTWENIVARRLAYYDELSRL